MPYKESAAPSPKTSFQFAYQHLLKVSEENPAWFDMAREILKKVNTGEQLILGALVEGLKAAHAMGREGILPEQDPEMVPYRTQVESKPARVTRTPVPAPTPTRVRRTPPT